MLVTLRIDGRDTCTFSTEKRGLSLIEELLEEAGAVLDPPIQVAGIIMKQWGRLVVESSCHTIEFTYSESESTEKPN